MSDETTKEAALKADPVKYLRRCIRALGFEVDPSIQRDCSAAAEAVLARLEAVTKARDEACDLFIGLLVEVSSMTKSADSSALRKLVCGDSEWKDMMAAHDETIVAATERAAALRKAGQ